MRLTSLSFPSAFLALLLPAVGPLVMQGAPLDAGAGFRPVLVVEAVYPGASAQVVTETVAAPIEQQVNGLEHLATMVSRCTDDGRYTLLLSFGSAADLDRTEVLLQNRVSLATPALPEEVRKIGTTVRKRSPGASLAIVLTSPDASRDTFYLGRYTSLHIKDELARVAGVGGISLLGCDDFALRAFIDQDKLAARNITLNDVLKALRQANVQATIRPAEQRGARTEAPLELRLETVGRMVDSEGLDDLTVKASPDGMPVQLRDVARVEVGRGPPHREVNLDARPAVALALSVIPTANARDVSAAVRERMASLKRSFPTGLDYAVAVDFLPPGRSGGAASRRCLLVEPSLSPAASEEQFARCRKEYAEILGKTEGVQHVLSLPEDPFARFRGGPCVVAVFGPETKEADWEQTRQALRARLARGVPAAEPRLRDLAGPAGVRPAGYPVDLALRGPETRAVRDFGKALAARLRQTGRATYLVEGPRLVRRREAEIDRKKAAQLGMALTDITEILQIAGDSRDALRLQVRNNDGRMAPLETVVAIREVEVPATVDRVDLRPAVTVSGNLAAGVSLAEARWLCEKMAEQVREELKLPAEYGLVWLQDVPAPKPMAAEPKLEPEPVPEVKVIRPVSREVTDSEKFTGRLEASQSVELRARVSGYVVKAAFVEGGRVKKGDLLFGIDPRPYLARLDQAQSEVKLSNARVKLAKAACDRLQAAKAGQRELDEAKAAVEEAMARLMASEAAVEVRKLDVDLCRVAAPIDGIAGLNRCTPGNLAQADQTVLTTVVSSDPMYVFFDVDERTVLTMQRAVQDGRGQANKPIEMQVSVGLANENGFPHAGKLTFIDNRINPETGTLTMRAVVPNAKNLLRPGMFARVCLAVGAPYKALLVPEEAAGSDQGAKFVYVVAEGDKVAYRTVTLGAKQDGLRVVTKGLHSDDRVIVEGQGRVRPGQLVKPIAGQP